MKKYQGVQFSKKFNSWQARVTSGGVIYNCGTHKSPEAAARARDIKIIEKNLPQKLQILKPVKKND